MTPEQFQACMAGAKEYEAKIVQVASNIGEAQAAKQQGDTQLAEKRVTEARTIAGEATNVATKMAEAAEKTNEKTNPLPASDAKSGFFDDFKGKTLAGRWQIIRPNDDNYALEKDGLLIINSKAGSLDQDNIPNLFRLETAMPNGDWTATVKFSSEFPLGNESFFLALFQDKDHWTAASLNAQPGQHNQSLDIGLSRKSSDEIVRSAGSLAAQVCIPCANWNKFISEKNLNQPIYLRLQRTGHDFVASSRLETSGPDTWVTTNKIASLSALGNLVIGFTQTSKGTGQTQVTVEWVRVESP